MIYTDFFRGPFVVRVAGLLLSSARKGVWDTIFQEAGYYLCRKNGCMDCVHTSPENMYCQVHEIQWRHRKQHDRLLRRQTMPMRSKSVARQAVFRPPVATKKQGDQIVKGERVSRSRSPLDSSRSRSPLDRLGPIGASSSCRRPRHVCISG